MCEQLTRTVGLQKQVAGRALNDGWDYTTEEAEYLKAVQAYRVANPKVKFMTATDYLFVLLSMGYRK